jgi:hypothetical protein
VRQHIHQIEIDDVKEDLIFEVGDDYLDFFEYMNFVKSQLFEITDYNEFLEKAKWLYEQEESDERYKKWRFSFFQMQERKLLERRKSKKGFKPVKPKVLIGSIEEVIKLLNECSKNNEIIFKLKELVRDNYFDRRTIKEKGFFTFFSIALFGESRKASLYNTYRELLKSGTSGILND